MYPISQIKTMRKYTTQRLEERRSGSIHAKEIGVYLFLSHNLAISGQPNHISSSPRLGEHWKDLWTSDPNARQRIN